MHSLVHATDTHKHTLIWISHRCFFTLSLSLTPDINSVLVLNTVKRGSEVVINKCEEHADGKKMKMKTSLN